MEMATAVRQNRVQKKKIIKQQPRKSKHNEEGHGAAIQSRDGNKKGKSDETCRVCSFPDESLKKWEEKDNPLEIAIKCLKRNKGVVLSVIMPISIEMWVSNL
ncbi:hypothetical protein REPUB_Repub08aG0075500 [Reevesia pubescens]